MKPQAKTDTTGGTRQANQSKFQLVVYGHPRKSGVGSIIAKLADWCNERGHMLSIDDQLCHLVETIASQTKQPFFTYDGENPNINPFKPSRDCLLICLGGDGTLIHAVRRFWPLTAPVIGVNLGQIGFNASVEPDRLCEVIDLHAKGEAAMSERMVLRVQLERDGQVAAESIALNDVVLAKRSETRMIHVTLLQGREVVSSFGADGLIVSTPTGSTAYNLSAGGPIVHPAMELLIATAICPHSLSARPVVLPPDPPVTLQFVPRHDTGEAMVWIDGQEGWPMGPGDQVTLKATDSPLRLVTSPEMRYFERLRQKLLWNGDVKTSG